MIKEIVAWVITILTLTFPIWSLALILLDAWLYDKKHDYCDVIEVKE